MGARKNNMLLLALICSFSLGTYGMNYFNLTKIEENSISESENNLNISVRYASEDEKKKLLNEENIKEYSMLQVVSWTAPEGVSVTYSARYADTKESVGSDILQIVKNGDTSVYVLSMYSYGKRKIEVVFKGSDNSEAVVNVNFIKKIESITATEEFSSQEDFLSFSKANYISSELINNGYSLTDYIFDYNSRIFNINYFSDYTLDYEYSKNNNEIVLNDLNNLTFSTTNSELEYLTLFIVAYLKVYNSFISLKELLKAYMGLSLTENSDGFTEENYNDYILPEFRNYFGTSAYIDLNFYGNKISGTAYKPVLYIILNNLEEPLKIALPTELYEFEKNHFLFSLTLDYKGSEEDYPTYDEVKDLTIDDFPWLKNLIQQ